MTGTPCTLVSASSPPRSAGALDGATGVAAHGGAHRAPRGPRQRPASSGRTRARRHRQAASRTRSQGVPGRSPRAPGPATRSRRPNPSRTPVIVDGEDDRGGPVLRLQRPGGLQVGDRDVLAGRPAAQPRTSGPGRPGSSCWARGGGKSAGRRSARGSRPAPPASRCRSPRPPGRAPTPRTRRGWAAGGGVLHLEHGR